MENWKANNPSHFSTPATATGSLQNLPRYTNNLPGTKDRVGHPSFEPFDTLIVDEGQDLMLDRYWDVFDALTVGGISHGQVRVFYDPRQNLFCGRTGTIALRLKNSFPAKYELSVNCRNTQPTSIGGALVCGQTLGVTAKADGPESVMEFFLDVRDQ